MSSMRVTDTPSKVFDAGTARHMLFLWGRNKNGEFDALWEERGLGKLQDALATAKLQPDPDLSFGLPSPATTPSMSVNVPVGEKAGEIEEHVSAIYGILADIEQGKTGYEMGNKTAVQKHLLKISELEAEASLHPHIPAP